MAKAYEEAKAGGKHAGFLSRHEELPDHLVEKAMRSFRRQISMHKDWIAQPERKLGPGAPPDKVRNLVEIKWPNDIKRLQAQLDILRGILQERKK